MPVSSQIQAELKKGGKLPIMQGLPEKFSSFIQATCEVNPQLTMNGHSATAILSNGTTQTILAAATDRDYYITGASLSVVRDATAALTAASISVTNEFGAVISILQIPGLTLTAGDNTVSTVFRNPIKILRNTAVNVLSNSATANFRAAAQISYYYDDDDG